MSLLPMVHTEFECGVCGHTTLAPKMADGVQHVCLTCGGEELQALFRQSVEKSINEEGSTPYSAYSMGMEWTTESGS